MGDTLHCPNCGAAISSDSAQCQYCHSLLQTVACPSCMGLMFEGNEFCPHCGIETVHLTKPVNTDRFCPRCDGKHLSTVQCGNVQFDQCAGCGGMWLSRASFERICRDAEAQSAALTLSTTATVVSETVHYLKCPICRSLMNRTNFAHRSGVIIDVCKAHGVWFDRDELRRIIEFIRAGGMERAHQAELEKLERERRAAVSPPFPLDPRGAGSLLNNMDSTSGERWFNAIAAFIGTVFRKLF